jgi:ribosomal protein S18 acetylase RimI-like enzyme
MLHIAPLDLKAAALRPQLQAVLQRAHAQEAALLPPRLQMPPARTLDEIGDAGEHLLGAWMDSELCGALSVAPDDEPGQISISLLVVDPDWQRRGIARALVLDALRRGAGAPFSVTTLGANAPALALYAGLGFEPIRHGLLGAQQLPVVKLRRPPG